MSLLINVAAQFSGKKALKDAQKSVNVLETSVRKLGTTLGVSLSAAAVVAFGKASVKAFAEDEKAANRLANVLDNLGLSFANLQIQGYIEDLSKASGVVDDQLRPAFQALITTTGSLTQSQKLLAQAVDVSAGSGVDLATVANDLAQAYVGNTRGLRKYNLGLTQAELKAAKFVDIQARLTTLFSGANAQYLETYAGKMQLLTTAAGEAQEVIGQGLVDALTILAGKDAGIQDVADSMANVAEEIGNVTRGLALMIKQVGEIPLLGDAFKLLGLSIKNSPLGLLLSTAAKKGATKQSSGFSFFGSPMETTQKARDTAAATKAEKDAAKRAKAIADATKKNTAELKKQAALKKAQGIFDLDKIQVIAALQGKISEDEKLRLQLQLALLMGNEEYAKSLSEKLAASQLKTAGLATALKDLPTQINPFKDWVSDLDKTLQKLREIAAFNKPSVGNGSTARGESFAALSPTVQDLVTGGGVGGAGRAGVDAAGNVYVTVNGSVVSDGDLIDAIENGLQARSLSGSPSAIGRIMGMFG